MRRQNWILISVWKMRLEEARESGEKVMQVSKPRCGEKFEMEMAGRRKKFCFSWRKHQFCFVGVGKPLIPERCRMLLALRINVLAKGYSGISLETLKQVIEVFNGNATDTQLTLR